MIKESIVTTFRFFRVFRSEAVVKGGQQRHSTASSYVGPHIGKGAATSWPFSRVSVNHKLVCVYSSSGSLTEFTRNEFSDDEVEGW